MSVNNVTISIIVPVYNSEKYLHRCIDSILAQTFTDFELLLIDDGSTDSSGKICDKYLQKDSRVRIFHKKNGGAYSARNLGVDNAKGKWILFCDSDDCLEKDALEILRCSADDVVDAIIANVQYDATISGDKWIKLLLDCKIRCEVWGVLYRKDVLRKLKYIVPSSIVIGEDFLMNVQYAQCSNNIKLISNHLYCYTTHNVASILKTYKLTLEHEKEMLLFLDMLLEGNEQTFAYEIFRKKYLTLERLIHIGLNPYNEQWVKSIMQEHLRYKKRLGFKERFLLSVPYALISRLVLKAGLYVKAHCKFIQ